MQSAEPQEISAEESIDSQNQEEFCYQEDSSEKQELFYGSDDEKRQQLCPKLLTMHSLNHKNNSISQQSVESSKSRPPRSIFHNFQKHLVITLRQLIKIIKSTHKNQSEYLAYQLWANFVKQTKIYTKNILQFVFGVADFESNNLKKVYNEEIIQKFGFSEIFSNYSDSMIRQAQQLIRKEVIKQVKETDLKRLLKSRRIGTTDKLKDYIKEFISELEQGPMRKRLLKLKKEKMIQKKKQPKQEMEK